MTSNPVTRNNLIAMTILWSMAGFVQYLIMFYSKYFGGDVFINYAIQGIADIFCMIYVTYLAKYMSVPKIITFLVGSLIAFTILNMVQHELWATYHNFQVWIMPIMIVSMRM